MNNEVAKPWSDLIGRHALALAAQLADRWHYCHNLFVMLYHDKVEKAAALPTALPKSKTINIHMLHHIHIVIDFAQYVTVD